MKLATGREHHCDAAAVIGHLPDDPRTTPDAVSAIRIGWYQMGQIQSILVVDNNRSMLEIVSRLLESADGFEIVGEATSGREALEMVDRLRPDILLMDLMMRGMDGIEATRRLLTRPTSPAVVIMTVHDQPHYRAAALLAGASDFIAKPDLPKLLVPVLQSLRPTCKPQSDVSRLAEG